MANPRTKKLSIVQWILKYDIICMVLSLVVKKGGPLVVEFMDFNYSGNLDGKNSIIGYVFTLGE